MHNSSRPALDELPSRAQLLKSTIIAAVAAVVILFTIVLPAEYGIDPTGAGRVLGLTSMGEIKQQLSKEAREDDHSSKAGFAPHHFVAGLLNALMPAAYAQQADINAEDWQEKVEFVLEPGASMEVKLKMSKGSSVEFTWIAEGGRINYDLHAHGNGESTGYAKGRGVTGDTGNIVAAFDGNHGWFWRNRDKQDVRVTLYVRGDYEALIQ